MPNNAVWIDRVEIALVGQNVTITTISNDETYKRVMSRSIAVRAAYDILNAVERSERCEVVPFRNTV